jgi:hypothetical protein
VLEFILDFEHATQNFLKTLTLCQAVYFRCYALCRDYFLVDFLLRTS